MWRERSERQPPSEAHEQRAAEKGRDARWEGAKAERSRRLRSIKLRRTTERPTNEADRPLSAARVVQAAFSTFPLRIHRVQTSSRFTPPPTFARTDCRLGFHRRRVRLLA